LIAQSFCVIKFYQSIKEIEKASDIGIRRGQKEYPLASVIYSPMNPKGRLKDEEVREKLIIFVVSIE